MASPKSLTALKRFSSCDVRPIHVISQAGKYRQSTLTLVTNREYHIPTDRRRPRQAKSPLRWLPPRPQNVLARTTRRRHQDLRPGLHRATGRCQQHHCSQTGETLRRRDREGLRCFHFAAQGVLFGLLGWFDEYAGQIFGRAGRCR
jgi:hypothetical protein